MAKRNLVAKKFTEEIKVYSEADHLKGVGEKIEELYQITKDKIPLTLILLTLESLCSMSSSSFVIRIVRRRVFFSATKSILMDHILC